MEAFGTKPSRCTQMSFSHLFPPGMLYYSFDLVAPLKLAFHT